MANALVIEFHTAEHRDLHARFAAMVLKEGLTQKAVVMQAMRTWVQQHERQRAQGDEHANRL